MKLTLIADTTNGIYQGRLSEGGVDSLALVRFDDFLAGLKSLKEGETLAAVVSAAELDELIFAGYRVTPPQYCSQNKGDCLTCSLGNYGADCQSIKIE